MNSYEDRTYDVVIMGGGPAGATLAALLAGRAKLSVAVFEKEFFPREHIGESLGHAAIPPIEESGALAKVLASECWVKKPGGFYAWDPKKPPFATIFDAESVAKDGVPRWSLHVNRSEFDDILLRHAESVGAHVFEGVAVTGIEREGERTRIELGEAGFTHARLFVEASGRTTSMVAGPKKHLSKYRNIAIWNHVVGGKPAHSLAGDWNIYPDKDAPPIGSFAFEDGWFWYIPVPKMIMGKRVQTHSLGMVTDPRVLRDPTKKYTEMRHFMERARKVPRLGELIAEAEPVADKVLTATNYSMISERFCSYDDRWMLIGDSAYFVDPLFSSGVAFALGQAAAAATVIEHTFGTRMPEALARELWDDYEERWKGVAGAFALAIDQWYHAIARASPDSIYWSFRAKEQMFEASERPFQALVDTGVSPNLLRVITRGSVNLDALGNEGPLVEAVAHAKRMPAPEARLRLADGVAIKDSVMLDVGTAKGPQPYGRVGVDPARSEAARYWTDPLANGKAVAPLHPPPRACHRFHFDGDRAERAQVRFDDALHGGCALFDRLRSGSVVHGALRESLTPGQCALLDRLLLVGMVVEA